MQRVRYYNLCCKVVNLLIQNSELSEKSTTTYDEYLRKSTVEGQTLEVDQRQIDLDIPRTKISLYKYVLRQQLIEEDADLATEPVALYMNAARNILSAYSVVGNKALRQVSQMM